ncbi:fasciclin domain-containing protein [Aliifodinibius sp. S!AR15-10]|uniref:fasciclin domain-containing protein n=1 Tax=Aliifodinibius sp. S!AR15-10 TaxID=2950437 RepID=UPI00285B0820|nr:fasciclin domain-containing protein [Aliifodinibius sp. S!AR15-10]MDR8391281.1 fasciclin domain-containing protein [Aliifodinibius sp. S!AR15-10]
MTHFTAKFCLVLILAFTVTFVACDLNSSNSTPEPELDLIEKSGSYDDLASFVQAVEDAELSSDLKGTGPFTIFAPTNEAFEKLPEGMLDTMSTEQLAELVEYQVIEDEIYAGDFGEKQPLESRQGDSLFVVLDDSIYVDGKATVIAGNIVTTNGILYALNEVPLPDKFHTVFGIIEKRYRLQTLQEGIRDAALTDTLNKETESGYTVFAPSEVAFEDADLPDGQQELEEQLTYHVIPSKMMAEDLEDGQTIETSNGETITIEVEGDTISINGNAVVTQADLEGTNGVVHIIDGLLDPSSE